MWQQNFMLYPPAKILCFIPPFLLHANLHPSLLPSAPDFEPESYSTLTQPQPNYPEGVPPVSRPPQVTSKYSRAMQIFRSIMASKQEEPRREREDSQSKEFRVIFQDGKMDIIVEDWDSEKQWLAVL